MKQTLILLLLAFTVNCVSAQVKHPLNKAEVTFKIKNMGIGTGGKIGGVKTDINFSKDKPESSSIEATADVNAIDTDNEARDKHLKSGDYFDAAKYPKITMKSVSIKHKSGNNYLGVFNVTIKDKTKTFNVPFTYTVTGGTATFQGGFKMQRTDFGIGSKGLVLGNDVTVDINIETTP